MRLVAAGMLFCLSLPSAAADFTVGPAGTYATIQDGIDAALAAAGDDRVLVQAGTYTENVVFNMGGAGDRLELSGGWDAGFSSQASRASTIDGNAMGRVIDVSTDGSDHVVVSNFEITNGLAVRRAGMQIYLRGNAIAEVTNNAITNNLAESDRTSGGGLFASVYEDSHLAITGNTISGNIARSLDTVDVRGGGLDIQTGDSATLTVTDNIIVDNSALIESPGSSRAGGVEIYSGSSEPSQFSGNIVARNITGGSGRSGTGLFLVGEAWQVERNQFLQNPPGDTAAFARQVSLAVWGTTGSARDNLVAESGGKGISVSASGTASAHVTNLTAVNIEEADIQAHAFDETATVTIFNSIASDSSTQMLINASVDVGNNLFGGTLGLVDMAGGDYRLTETSPARNAGTNSPPGGLGATDLDDRPRISEGVVDIGAFEYPGPIFQDRFEGAP